MKEGWQIKKLGDLATYVNGFAFKPTDWSNDGIPIIRIQNLNSEKDVFNYYQGNLLPRYLVKNGDVLISWSASLGVYFWTGGDAWLNQHIFKVVFNKEKINVRYFVYVVESLLSKMKKLVHGATMQHITKGKFDNIDVPVPSLAEQQRIVDVLDAEFAKIDALKANAEKNLQNAKDLFQAVLKKELEPKEGWIKKCFGDICKSQLGKTLNATTDTGDETPYLCAVNVRWDSFDLSVIKSAPFRKEEIDKYTIQKGDLLVCEGGEAGRAAIWNSEDTVQYQNAIHRIRFADNTVNPRYGLYYLWLLKINGILDREYSHGATILHLVTKSLYSIPIEYPSIQIQDSIVQRIDNIKGYCQSIQDNYTQTIALCDDLKQSLLRKAFNGEL